ncbi:hypothetical protein [Endozoicomonas arenosclerae]|uniref:hypothetical protein n=1 Tax=Endozoicomonas arenosclerae TaxID=1633495 RepID=UPI0007836AB5|nr:hypothetical protein [Endozoicomonas arenosclerae]
MQVVRCLFYCLLSFLIAASVSAKESSNPLKKNARENQVEFIALDPKLMRTAIARSMKGPPFVAAMDSGAVMYFDGNDWQTLHDAGWGSPARVLSVDWRSSGQLPRIVVGLDNSAVEYYDGQKWHELLADVQCYKSNSPEYNAGHLVSMVVKWGDWPKVVAGMQCGLITYYDSYKWKELHNSGWTAPANGLSVDWSVSGTPRVAVGLGQYNSKTPGGAVEYFDGSGWSELQGTGWAAGVNQMSVLWPKDSKPWVVAGLGQFDEGTTAGAVEYFNGSNWRELHNTGWVAPVNQMAARWQDVDHPQVVVGLGQYNLHTAGGAVEYYDGSQWHELLGTGWLAPVNQMEVNWQGNSSPKVLIVLGQYQPNSGGAIEYFNGKNWTELHDANWLANHVTTGVTQLSADWSQGGNPRAVIALGKVFPIITDGKPPRSGEIQFYNGKDWVLLHDSDWNNVVNALSVDWTAFTP